MLANDPPPTILPKKKTNKEHFIDIGSIDPMNTIARCSTAPQRLAVRIVEKRQS